MTNYRRKYINEFAQKLLEVTEKKVPLSMKDLKDIVKKIDGKIVEIDQPNVGEMKDGRIELESNGKFTITLNTYFNIEERRKFSCAHELGHLFLHILKSDGRVNDSVYYRYGGGVEEREANEFAAALLMPEELFVEIAERYLDDDNVYIINPIADYFGVSKEAVIARGRNLSLWK